MTGWLGGIQRAARRPVSSASLAVFRMAFGAAMVINTALYLPVLVNEYYVEPGMHFSYGPFDMVVPLPALGMYAVYAAMAVTGALIALGRWYRWATGAFFVLTTYVFLLDSTFFQNHEYLISLLALMLVLLPADCRWSLDVRARPDRWSPTVPAWVVWMLRFQIGVPYVYGGIAKLNHDWLRGEPLRQWLAQRTDIEPIHTILTTEWVVWTMTYGALVLDLTVVWLLLLRRTRLAAFAVATCFHLLNVWLFGLFIFPWLMIAATTIFFPPDWPERVAGHRWLRGMALPPDPTSAPTRRQRAPRWLVALFGAWVVVQLVVPLRHYAIDGSPSWTEEGHRFAWHMMLRAKHGSVTFHVTTPEGTWQIDPGDHLGEKQAARLPGHPERLVRFAHHLSELYGGAEVRAETLVSLNGRAPQPIVDPTVDLASVDPVWWRHASWITPLETPLRS